MQYRLIYFFLFVNFIIIGCDKNDNLKKTYKISFNSNGGSEVATQSVEEQKLLTKPQNPTKNNDTFSGWFLDEELTILFDFSKPITANLTLYAKWISNSVSTNTYTVNFNTNGGNSINPQKVIEGKTITRVTDPSKSGYIFSGWYFEETFINFFSDTTPIYKNIILYAKWTEAPPVGNCIVIFNSNGGNDIASQTILVGKTVSRPNNPSKNGSTFSAWYSDAGLQNLFDFSKPITTSIILYAKWSSSNPTTTDINANIFTYNPTTGVITGLNQNYADLSVINIPATIAGIAIKKINNNAFASNSNVTQITIAEGIDSIGEGAFNNCSKLSSISMPNSIKYIGDWAFANSNFNTITLSHSIIKIPESCFSFCTKLSTINIPDNITTIAKNAFYYCTALKNIMLSNNLTSIEDNAFYYCTGLENVVIPNKVAYIGEEAFYNCSSLITLSLPNGLTFIGNRAFSSCSSLSSLTLPNSVNNLGTNVWNNCSKLETLELNIPLTSIDRSMFVGCEKLINITLPNTLLTIEKETFHSFKNIVTINIPNSVKTIKKSAFYGCTGLTSIVIPNNVTVIDSMCFYGCSALNNITIPFGVNTIAYLAFYGCSALTSLTLPSTLTTIGSNSTLFCSALRTLTINSLTPPNVINGGSSGFNGLGTELGKGVSTFISIKVPSIALNTYKNNSFWSKHSGQMSGI